MSLSVSFEHKIKFWITTVYKVNHRIQEKMSNFGLKITEGDGHPKSTVHTVVCRKSPWISLDRAGL